MVYLTTHPPNDGRPPEQLDLSTKDLAARGTRQSQFRKAWRGDRDRSRALRRSPRKCVEWTKLDTLHRAEKANEAAERAFLAPLDARAAEALRDSLRTIVTDR